LKKRSKVLEIVKREASTTSIRSDVIQGAHAIRPFTRDGRMPSRVSGRRASASALDDRQPVDVGPVCQARKRFGRRWVGPPGPSVKSPVPGARRRSGVQRAPPPGGGDPPSPMTGGRTSTRRVRIHGDSERGDLPRAFKTSAKWLCSTRLGTRTKESNMNASQRIHLYHIILGLREIEKFISENPFF